MLMKSIYLFLLTVLVSFTFVPVPFARSEKAMPAGSWNRIIPKYISDYKQIAFKHPTAKDDGAAYYKKGTQLIYVSFNKLKNEKAVQDWMNDARGNELGNDAELNKVDVASKSKFVFYGKENKYFFAWNRGLYCFDVLCENGKDEMDRFMKAFPY
jgi:hypothetical protein